MATCTININHSKVQRLVKRPVAHVVPKRSSKLSERLARSIPEELANKMMQELAQARSEWREYI